MTLWPGAMSSRIFAILLLGIVSSALLTWWLAFGERQRAIGQFRDSHMIERIEQIMQTLSMLPVADRSRYLERASRRGVRLEAWHGPLPASALVNDEFSGNLTQRLGPTFQAQALANKPPACEQANRRSGFSLNKTPPAVCGHILISLPDQSRILLTILPPRNLQAPRPDPIWLVLFVLSVGILAWFVARMTMRPLAELAQAATNLGRDINHPPLLLHGASEIRQASNAFNAMQARIRKHVTQRTQMLAAITHDLQTPLTRLRLRLEKVQDEELRDKLVQDLSAMQQMVKEGLDLARSIDSSETMQLLDIDSLLDSVCSDAQEAGQAVQLQGQTGVAIHARPLALRRCLVNLIDNAIKYGQSAQVSIALAPGGICIRIRDAGPGIAEEELARVFEPFYRLETSRSRESGGTGLGLTIAQNVAEQHGGTLTLANCPQGGLEAVLHLPREFGNPG